jgi:hypothetical protein
VSEDLNMGAGIAVQVRKTVALSHLCIRMNILPRQARDKHRENSKTDRVRAVQTTLRSRR